MHSVPFLDILNAHYCAEICFHPFSNLFDQTFINILRKYSSEQRRTL